MVDNELYGLLFSLYNSRFNEETGMREITEKDYDEILEQLFRLRLLEK